MSRLLFAWIGLTDLRAMEGDEGAGLGPIGQALKSMPFDGLALLSNHPRNTNRRYQEWIQDQARIPVFLHEARLSSPTHFGEVYEAAVQAVTTTMPKTGEKSELTFHISPGTPAMAAVWVILAKTRFPATLIESSREHGVRVVSIPFEMSADYLPDLLRRPDEELRALSEALPPETPEFGQIVHECAEMKRLIRLARQVAPRMAPVLILGESGTGKELLARAIHSGSPRKDKPFVAVNCGAIPRDLVEAELFGHKKGAFTGATADRKGFLETAHQGTLFLDEIGELPLASQVRLLRALQEGAVTRVGDSRPTAVDIRIICATNRDLIREVGEGRFREDLFHRIAVGVLRVPPLRDRGRDIHILIDRLLDGINRASAGQPGHCDKRLSAGARKVLASHDWPGNIRELHNTLMRLVIWTRAEIIEAGDVREAILPMAPPAAQNILDRPLGEGFRLEDMLADVARRYLRLAMAQSGGNKTKAARLVGLRSYQTLDNWLKRYGV